MVGKKNETEKKKNDRSGKCGRSKKLTIMVRVERQARREWKNWKDKVKDLCVKTGKFQL